MVTGYASYLVLVRLRVVKYISNPGILPAFCVLLQIRDTNFNIMDFQRYMTIIHGKCLVDMVKLLTDIDHVKNRSTISKSYHSQQLRAVKYYCSNTF